MENKPVKKVFIPLLSATVFIFGFSHAGSFALNKFTEAEVIQPSTMVATINVGGQSQQSAKDALAQAVSEWKSAASMTAELSGQETDIDLSLFSIDINQSIQTASGGGANPLAVTVDMDSLMNQLTANYPDMSVEEMDTASFQQDLISQASMLPSSSVFSLSDYFEEGSVEEVTAEALSDEISVTPEIKRFIETFPEMTVNQGTEFSFLRHMEENGFTSNEKSEELSVITSLLYKLVLQSNFSIIERNTSSELPDEIELGYEAKVDAASNQDFVFANHNNNDYFIVLELLDNQLYAKLIGFPLATDYKVSLKDKEEFPQKKIVQYNPFLEKNVVRVQEEGRKGVLIKVFRQSVGENGEVMDEKLIAEDFYPPVHRIEIHSLDEAPEDVDEKDIVDTPLTDSDENTDSVETNGPPPNSGSGEDSAGDEDSSQSDSSTDIKGNDASASSSDDTDKSEESDDQGEDEKKK
ncbi:MAG: VanW family protein [Bacillota bacterium]